MRKILVRAIMIEPQRPTTKGFRPTCLKELKTVFKPIPARPRRMRKRPRVLKELVPAGEK